MNAVARSETIPARNATRIRDDRLRAELWLTRHLWRETGVDVAAGDTTPAQRHQRICELVLARRLADAQLGRFNGRPESYRQFLKRAVGVELNVAAAGQEALLLTQP